TRFDGAFRPNTLEGTIIGAAMTPNVWRLESRMPLSFPRSGRNRPRGVLLCGEHQFGGEQRLFLVLRDAAALDDIGDELRAEGEMDL
ncbi:hypothetical protein GY985_24040, partial [Escherichia coli]|nr:hypothetical protein [Escherichia coli]